jgi:hypothetical protein
VYVFVFEIKAKEGVGARHLVAEQLTKCPSAALLLLCGFLHARALECT